MSSSTFGKLEKNTARANLSKLTLTTARLHIDCVPVVALGHHAQILGLLEVLRGLAPLPPLRVVGAHLPPRGAELLVVAPALLHQLSRVHCVAVHNNVVRINNNVSFGMSTSIQLEHYLRACLVRMGYFFMFFVMAADGGGTTLRNTRKNTACKYKREGDS